MLRAETQGAPADRQQTGNDPLWDAVLNDLRGMMTPDNFDAWLAATIAERTPDDALIVTVRDTFHGYWLDTHLRGRIQDTLRRLDCDNVRVTFAVAS